MNDMAALLAAQTVSVLAHALDDVLSPTSVRTTLMLCFFIT